MIGGCGGGVGEAEVGGCGAEGVVVSVGGVGGGIDGSSNGDDYPNITPIYPILL